MADSYLAKKELGIFSLSFMGLSAMLGSGWLLASYFVFKQAGSYAPYAWLLGYGMVLVIALCYAETCSMIDRDGATIILPRLSHGYFLSAIFGFFGLISWVALIPIEVSATLQYLSFFVHSLYLPGGHFSTLGMSIAVMLVVVISLINSCAMSWIKSFNNAVFTPLKIGIPLLIIAYGLWHAWTTPALKLSHFHSFKGIFLAIPLGVIFSFNAFKTICVLAGRAKNPQKTITRSLMLSLTTCLLLYIGLQFTYDANATAAVLSQIHSPYAAVLAHASLMLVLLYIGAVSSPFTANIFNLNAGNSCCYRMAKLGYLPSFFKKNNRFHQYVIANAFNSVIAIILVVKSGTWDAMVQNLTCVMVITYAAAPIALTVFRKNLPSIRRPFVLRCATGVSLLAFILSNFMIFWCGFSALMLALEVLAVISVFILLYYPVSRHGFRLDLKRALWVYLWLGGMATISYYSVFGGIAKISHLVALALIVFLSLVVYVVMLKSCLPEAEALDFFEKL